MWKKVVLALVFADFAFLTVRALLAFGYMGVIEAFLTNAATQLLSADLIISLSLVSIWMFKDARGKGRNVWPYLLTTLVFGSAGPLAYLLVGAFQSQPRRVTESAAALG